MDIKGHPVNCTASPQTKRGHTHTYEEGRWIYKDNILSTAQHHHRKIRETKWGHTHTHMKRGDRHTRTTSHQLHSITTEEKTERK